MQNQNFLQTFGENLLTDKTFTYSEIIKESQEGNSKISYFNSIAFCFEGGALNESIEIIDLDNFEKGMKPYNEGGFSGSFIFSTENPNIDCVYYCDPQKLIVKNKSVVLKFGSLVDSKNKIITQENLSN